MNANYFPNPSFPGLGDNNYPQTAMGNVASTPSGNISNINKQSQAINNQVLTEQSFIENVLRVNQGKLATLYFSFPDSVEWRDKIFTGIIEAAGRDHVIISDPKTGKWYLLLMIYLNYVEFEEKINLTSSFYPHGL